jgi:hypothetical protein
MAAAMTWLVPLLLVALPTPSPVAPAPAVAAPSPSPSRGAAAAGARADPPIAVVQREAARHAGDLDGEADARGRARAAALLPRLTAEVRLDDRSYRVSGLQGSGEVDYARYAPGWLVAVRATWTLADLVDPPAPAASAQGLLERSRRRREAVRTATDLYFERRRLRMRLELDPPAAAGERGELELEVERLGAELDALTGGAFLGGAR